MWIEEVLVSSRLNACDCIIEAAAVERNAYVMAKVGQSAELGCEVAEFQLFFRGTE